MIRRLHAEGEHLRANRVKWSRLRSAKGKHRYDKSAGRRNVGQGKCSGEGCQTGNGSESDQRQSFTLAGAKVKLVNLNPLQQAREESERKSASILSLEQQVTTKF
jgi:hypothetical protein